MKIRRMGNIRKFFTLILIVSGIYLLIAIIRMKNILIVDRAATLEEIEKAIKRQSSGKSCKHPHLPINSTEMNKFFWDIPPINCNSAYPDWVLVQGSFCIINEEAKKKFGEIHCQFTDILREDDFSLTNGRTVYSTSQYQLIETDVVRVQCTATSGARWRSVLTGIRHDASLRSRTSQSLPDNVLPMDILIFGFDSLSHNTFIRKLPKTYKYLTKVLDAQVLNGYNIVGDGTPQALIPILTGQNELELPEARKRISGSGFVDVFPFVWKEFEKLGYITGYLEDTPSTGIFTYRFRGFQKQPTNHYMRPYYLAAEETVQSSPKYCIGAQPRHKIMLNYIEDFFKAYKRKNKFLFGFHGELSHDSCNLIGAADNDVLEWLQRLNTSGVFNNTIFMFMSDHGHRFAKIRDTIQGKQEERLPFFSITLPKWFRKKYKVAYSNLKKNVDRLTTPYDIFPTIKHLLNWDNNFGSGDLNQRSISLFNKVPEQRSCADAYIEPHWCTCLNWDSISTQTQLAKELANTLAQTINNYTSHVRHLCHQLYVNKIVWVTKLSPNDNMLKFQRSADYDGFIADLSGKVNIDSHLYQIKALMLPNNGIYEASITHYRNGTYHVNLSDISRINKYGSQANCIFETYPDLRKFCSCIS